MGSTTTKIVKGNEYLYYVYYNNRKKKEVYCGLASKSESTRKALEFELDQIEEQRDNLLEKSINIKSRIKKFRT